MLSYENKTVEQLWNSFKSVINQGISKFIPIKRFGAKRSLPWVETCSKTRPAVSSSEEIGEDHR